MKVMEHISRTKRWLRFSASLLLMFSLVDSAFSSTKPSNNKLLIASDFHFNPFADPALVADLAAAPAAQWEAIFNRSKLTAFSRRTQDTNWWLLQSSLNAMHATLAHPAMVMITGDSLAHGFPQKYKTALQDGDDAHYRAFVLKTMEFFALELRKTFPATQILITPGNNDDECGDYDIEAGGPFLNDTATVVQNLAKTEDDQFLDDWKSLGSYSIQPVATPGVRIISLNTVFFSNEYKAASFTRGCAVFNSDAPSRAFAWLESNLSQARKAHEKVWLMFHIPPGIDGYSTMFRYAAAFKVAGFSSSPAMCSHAIVPMWKPEWTAKFSSLLEGYQDTVAASFAGHDHTDDYRLIGTTGAQGMFVLIDPPISPIFGQNPSFRVVTFKKNGDLIDQSTYYLANLQVATSTQKGQWKQEYTFTRQWHSQQLDASRLQILYGRIRDNAEVRAQWLTLFNVSSSTIKVPLIAAPGLYCASSSLDPASYQACYCPDLQEKSNPVPKP